MFNIFNSLLQAIKLAFLSESEIIEHVVNSEENDLWHMSAGNCQSKDIDIRVKAGPVHRCQNLEYLEISGKINRALLEIQEADSASAYDLALSLSRLAESVSQMTKELRAEKKSSNRYFTSYYEQIALSNERRLELELRAFYNDLRHQIESTGSRYWFIFDSLVRIKADLKKLFRSYKIRLRVQLHELVEIDFRELLEKLICPRSKKFARGALHIYG